MKVCFPVAVNSGLDSKVYNHFGSAPMFLIVNVIDKTVEVFDNTNAHHEHGTCNPVVALGNQKVDAIVVGGIGAGALTKLNSMGIMVFQAETGTVKANLDQFIQGKLKELGVSLCCSDHHEKSGQKSGHSCNH